MNNDQNASNFLRKAIRLRTALPRNTLTRFSAKFHRLLGTGPGRNPAQPICSIK